MTFTLSALEIVFSVLFLVGVIAPFCGLLAFVWNSNAELQ